MNKIPIKNSNGFTLLGYVFLNPLKPGFVSSSIKVKLETYELY